MSRFAVDVRADSAQSWGVALATLVLASLSFGAVTSVPILYVPIADDFSWSSSVVSSIHMSAMFGAGVGSLVIGRILDRRGFFAVAVAGACATGFGLWVASRAQHLWEMYVAYGLLVGAIGQGAFFSPLAAAVSLWFERHRAFAVAIALSGQSIGGLAVPPLLRMSAELSGWRTALQGYALVATVGLLLGASLFLRRPPALGACAASGVPSGRLPHQACAKDGERAGCARDSRVAAFLWLGTAAGCSNFATFGLVGHLAAYGEHVGTSATGAASLMAVLLGVALISRLAVGHLLDRWTMLPTLVAMSLLHTAGAAMLCVAGSPAQVAVAVVAVGLGFGGYLPAYGALVRSMYSPQEAGRRLSELYLLCFVGAGIGSWVMGVLRDLAGGYRPAFMAGALSATAAVLILLEMRRRFPAWAAR